MRSTRPAQPRHWVATPPTSTRNSQRPTPTRTSAPSSRRCGAELGGLPDPPTAVRLLTTRRRQQAVVNEYSRQPRGRRGAQGATRAGDGQRGPGGYSELPPGPPVQLAPANKGRVGFG